MIAARGFGFSSRWRSGSAAFDLARQRSIGGIGSVLNGGFVCGVAVSGLRPTVSRK